MWIMKSKWSSIWIVLPFMLVYANPRCHTASTPDSRELMVRAQIEARGVTDSLTLAAMRSVPRHEFVPEAYRAYAYDDTPLPIGWGQTISQPYIVALMTELARPGKGHRVLEVGTGSGYQAAVLSQIVDTVFSIEIIPELAAESADRLRRLGYGNVQVRQGDGYAGWAEHAPFDAILVTAASEEIPKPLCDQLRDGGVMVIPVGAADQVQSLTLVTKQKGGVTSKLLIPVKFVPLIRR